MSVASDAATLVALLPIGDELADLARAQLDIAVCDERTNAMTTIKAPSTYTGRSVFGPTVLTFVDGVATYEHPLSEGLERYLLDLGYEIEGAPNPARGAPPIAYHGGDDQPVELNAFQDAPSAPVPMEPHFETTARLRDAAADPHPDDFPGLLVTGPNPDPHGPDVRCIEVGSAEWAARVKAQREAGA